MVTSELILLVGSPLVVVVLLLGMLLRPNTCELAIYLCALGCRGSRVSSVNMNRVFTRFYELVTLRGKEQKRTIRLNKGSLRVHCLFHCRVKRKMEGSHIVVVTLRYNIKTMYA